LSRPTHHGVLKSCAATPAPVTPPEPQSSRPEVAAAPSAADLETLRGGLRILCLRALGDAEAAEEAVQETLARAVEALRGGRLADRAKLAAYVAGIARHVCSHTRRDEKRTVSLDALPNGSGPVVVVDPLDSLITAADADRLRAVFTSLSDADRRLLRLCYYEDRTPAEAAAVLGEPPERVRKRKERALERLRRAFLDVGHDHNTTATEDQTSSGADPASGREQS
jgi:RNA polymerase sigma factor (sigma-70 family)